VRDGYHQLMAQEPGRWVMVDAALPKDEVQSQIRQVVLAKLGRDLKA